VTPHAPSPHSAHTPAQVSASPYPAPTQPLSSPYPAPIQPPASPPVTSKSPSSPQPVAGRPTKQTPCSRQPARHQPGTSQAPTSYQTDIRQKCCCRCTLVISPVGLAPCSGFPSPLPNGGRTACCTAAPPPPGTQSTACRAHLCTRAGRQEGEGLAAGQDCGGEGGGGLQAIYDPSAS
jgi:hypothetical protein